MQAGWLDDITNWFREQLIAMFQALVAFFTDLIVDAIEAALDLVATAIESLPVPDFVNQYSLNGLLAEAGPTIGWLISTFRIGECLAVISLGYTFRRMRKLFTLGVW